MGDSPDKPHRIPCPNFTRWNSPPRGDNRSSLQNRVFFQQWTFHENGMLTNDALWLDRAWPQETVRTNCHKSLNGCLSWQSWGQKKVKEINKLLKMIKLMVSREDCSLIFAFVQNSSCIWKWESFRRNQYSLKWKSSSTSNRKQLVTSQIQVLSSVSLSLTPKGQ